MSNKQHPPLMKKHSQSDLVSRLKTRKILGVGGEDDDGEVHRSKVPHRLYPNCTQKSIRFHSWFHACMTFLKFIHNTLHTLSHVRVTTRDVIGPFCEVNLPLWPRPLLEVPVIFNVRSTLI